MDRIERLGPGKQAAADQATPAAAAGKKKSGERDDGGGGHDAAHVRRLHDATREHNVACGPSPESQSLSLSAAGAGDLGRAVIGRMDKFRNWRTLPPMDVALD